MKHIYFVLSDAGDGSNSVEWVTDRAVIDKMRDLASTGDSWYSSGDGLQKHSLQFPDDFDLDSWIKLNRLCITTMEDMEDMEDFEDL